MTSSCSRRNCCSTGRITRACLQWVNSKYLLVHKYLLSSIFLRSSNIWSFSIQHTTCHYICSEEHPRALVWVPFQSMHTTLPDLCHVLLIYKHDNQPDKDCKDWRAVQSQVLLSCSFCVLIFPPTVFLAARADFISFLLVISRIRGKKSVMCAVCVLVSRPVIANDNQEAKATGGTFLFFFFFFSHLRPFT